MDNEQPGDGQAQETQVVEAAADRQEKETKAVAVAKPEKESETRSVSETVVEGKAKGKSPSTAIETLVVGMQLKGKVRNIVDFGAFIDIGVGRDGLAHISTLKKAGIDKTLKVGDSIEVQVRRVDLSNNRISLIIPTPNQTPKTALKDLRVDSMVTGRVMRLVDFGAFIDIGAQSDGLLHVSELPWGYVSHPSEVLKVGDEVKVRILEIDSQKRRISLSMKNSGQSKQVATMAQANDSEEQFNNNAFKFAYERALKDQRRHQRKRRA